MANTFIVNSLHNGTDDDPATLTLREAIELATGEGDLITFDPSLSGGTIWHSSFGPFDILAAKGLRIDGDINNDGVPDIRINANGFNGFFRIGAEASVTLEGLVLLNGRGTGMAEWLPDVDYLERNALLIDTSGTHRAPGGADGPPRPAEPTQDYPGVDGGHGADAKSPLEPALFSPNGIGINGRDIGAIVNAGRLTLDNVWMDGGNVVGNNGIGVWGGRGGHGSDAYHHNAGGDPDDGNDDPETPDDPGGGGETPHVDVPLQGGHGGRGGNGGPGGVGGAAAPIVNLAGATLTLNDVMINGYTVRGGDGGNGGNGGRGGNAGEGRNGDGLLYPNPLRPEARVRDVDGVPGYGGHGGDGGNGGDAAGVVVNFGSLILQTGYAAFGNTVTAGAAGLAGSGGAGGTIYTPNASLLYYWGLPGQNGEPGNSSGTTAAHILDRNGTLAGPGSATPTESLVFLHVETPTMLEGDPDDGIERAFTVNVVRFGNIDVPFTVRWTLKGWSEEKQDFTVEAQAGTVSLAAGSAHVAVAIRIEPDTIPEDDETFLFSLSDPTEGFGFGTRAAFLTVVDDDGEAPGGGETPPPAQGEPPPPAAGGTQPPSGTATPAVEQHRFGSGIVLLEGAAADLFGDSMFDFGAGHAVRFTAGVSRLSDLIVSGNEVRLASAGPGSPPITFDGDFSDGRFFLVPTADGAGADLFFQRLLADVALVEGEAVPEAAVNGAPHPAALTGDGVRSFRVTLSDKAAAADANALGVYEVDAAGNIVDARILFADVKADPTATASVSDVEAGHRLGFFIVHGGLEAAGPVDFAAAGGGQANVAGGAGLSLRVGGRTVEGNVFHAFAATLNGDGLTHARSGADPSGTGVRVAFEDLFGGGDRDFQDVVFRVDMLDGSGDLIL